MKRREVLLMALGSSTQSKANALDEFIAGIDAAVKAAEKAEDTPAAALCLVVKGAVLEGYAYELLEVVAPWLKMAAKRAGGKFPKIEVH